MSSSLSKFIKEINVKETIIMIILAVFVFLIVRMMFGGVLGVSLVVIENGPCPASSMCPTYDKGDMFLINQCSPDKIELGDVVVYESEYSSNLLIIHRVVNITIISDSFGDHYYFRVSGDNYDSNARIDSYNSTSTLIPYEAILGKTKFLIPKVGYIRLVMSDVPALRYIFLALIVAIFLYILLVPDDKKKKEKEENEDSLDEKNIKEDITGKTSKTKKNKFNFKLYFIGMWNDTKSYFKSLFIDKKKRKKVIIYASIILTLIIAIPILDTIIRHPDLNTGIVDISLRKSPSSPVDYLVLEDIVYLPFIIRFNHDGSWNKVFKEFVVVGIKNNIVISTMKWNSFYQKEGDLLLGGSLVFNVDDYNNTLPLIIKITYVVDYRFGSYATGSYNETFDTPLLP